MQRKLLFGNAADMGTDAEVKKELADYDAAEEETEREEREREEEEKEAAKAAKRSNKNLMRFD